ncbi:MAG TPA: fused MFS/spermidine synthase, partial [Candidatus Sulfotelmatobacter sp.]|nr:fused MFS/spermidine synthase [Candidatus Sulfotelmatobacter sp.]
MLTQIFGNTTHAIATVLSAFMAGLAVGSYLFGAFVDARRNPLLAYGLLEAGVGLYGLMIPRLFAFTQQAYIRVSGLADISPALVSLAMFALCFVVILVPTALMGATLPVLGRFCVTQVAGLGRRIGDLYAVNTLGAVVGCGLAGFALIPWLGLRGSTRLAVILNLVIGATVLLTVALQGWARAGEPVEAAPEKPARAPRTPLDAALLLGFGVSGAAAMIYENAWTRALTLVIGMSTYSFTIMLTTFLVGLGLGSLLYARRTGAAAPGIAAFGLLQLGIALSALGTIPLFERLPFLFLRLSRGLGDAFGQLLATQVTLSGLVMLLPTLLLGMAFPMVARIYTQSLYRVGSSVGQAYASNTLGAILGAFLGGFVLIPLVGVQRSIGLAVALNAATGVLLMGLDPRVRPVRRALAAAVMLAASAAGLWGFGAWDKGVMTSGVTIYADNYADLPTDALRREWMQRDELLYYREGVTATISVHRSAGSSYLYEKTNGKVDASIGDTPTQLLIGYLPMLFVPDARRVLVIGMGSGMTAKAAAAFPVERLEVVEIEPAVIEAARFFAQKNGRIHDDARARFIVADGRNYLLASPGRYDAILSEPSNPWIAGVGNLFTKEYYELALRKLTERGVFGQWMQTYAMAPDDLRMVYRTFAEVFPEVSLWAINDSDMLLIGSRERQHLRIGAWRKTLAARAAARRDLSELGFPDAASLLAMYLMPRPALLDMAGEAELNRDDYPRLEFSAPRNLGRETATLNIRLTRAHAVPPQVEDVDPAEQGSGRWAALLGQGYRAARDPERAREAAEEALRKSDGNVEARLLRAQLALEDSQPGRAAAELERIAKSPGAVPEGAIEAAKQLEADDAIRILSRIRDRDPERMEAQVGLADALVRAGRFRQAATEYQLLESQLPPDPRLAAGLGRALLGREEFGPALA